MTHIQTPEHRAALVRATDELIRSTSSVLPAKRIVALVSAADTQIWNGYRMLGAEVPPPATYVRDVIGLAERDIEMVGRSHVPAIALECELVSFQESDPE